MSDQNESRRTRPRPPPNRRRDKPQLSCNFCRRGKLKCDRVQPCKNCSRRGLDAQCIFITTPPTTGPNRRSTASGGVDVQERLRYLEDQVGSIVNDRASSQRDTRDVTPLPTPADSGASIGSPTTTTTALADGGRPADADYPDCSNWSSILRDLRKSENMGCSHKARVPVEGENTAGPRLLYGCRPAASVDELLYALPPRSMTSRMVSAYFNGLDLSSAIIHGPEFLKEYDNFWKAPKETPPLWIALLYGMLCTAIQFQKANPENTMLPDEDLDVSLNIYRDKLVQCLMFGKYTQGGPHAIPALIHYIVIELFDKKDADDGTWLVMGLVVNIARRMRYHIDPGRIGNLSPYEAEMRRRLWRSLIVIDSSLSESVGAERIIKDFDAVREPRNLLDTDFDASTTVLPPPRPDTEPTPMLYCSAKGKSLMVFGMVTDLVSRQPCDYADVMKYDSLITETWSKMPSCYTWRPLEQSITDSPQVIARRMYLEIVYLKARIVLHLRFTTSQRDQDKYAFSRKTLFESVCRLLEFHYICDEETQPNGQLFTARWRYLTAVHQNFLLASIAACFYLEHNKSNMEKEELETFKKLCRRSQGIWIRTSRSSTEAAKASEALRVSLDDADDTNATSENAMQQDFPMSIDPPQDIWDYQCLPSYFGSFDLPFAYTNLFDGLTVPPAVPDPEDTLLIHPIAGQSDIFSAPSNWTSVDH